jgi:hypothetical protein
MTFVAQCLEVPRASEPRLFDPPAFGAFVKIVRARDRGASPVPAADDEPDPFLSEPSLPILPSGTVYAMVYGSATASLEPFRRPAALGYSEEDLRRHQPQIFELLRTEFQGLLIGYADDAGALQRRIPAAPPRIHSWVYACTGDEIRALASDIDFLRAVLVGGLPLAGVPVDELAAACIRQARPHFPQERAFLVQAGKTLAAILAEDYDRLQAILRKL